MESEASFLQSKAWGDFQTAAGHRTVRFGDIQGYEHRLGPGIRYLYVPRYEIRDKRYFEAVLNDIRQQKRCIFLRIEPIKQISPISYLQSPTRNRQPQHTLLIDLSKTEEELIAGMHPKTRYNVHLAERHGVVVREEKIADIFWRLHEETASRDKFRGHPRAYYEKMLASTIARQLIAYQGATPIASHILIAYGDTCTYLHGASSNEHRNLMAPYLLQWEGMKLGKRFGCRSYDLWGVAPLKNPKSETRNPNSCFHDYCWDPTHPWSGITRFKAGFGGMPVSYPQAVDIVLSPLRYRLYKGVQRLREML